MKYSLAIGKYRDDKRWQNKQVTWEDFVKKISETHRTTETLDEYIKFKKDRQDEIKDIGGFVSGHLSGGRRLVSAVTTKQILTFDADDATPDFWDKFCLNYGCSAALYSTHKHTPEAPRVRLLIPLSREVFADEYSAIVRRIASDVGINMFDATGYQVNRLMYWPSTSIDGEFVFKEQKGNILDADEVLATYTNWQDVSQWPIGIKENKILNANAKKQGEPTEKPGLIGAFNRAYGIDSAIMTFLSDVYESCDVENRYTYKEGSTSAGVVVYDDKFTFSHHSTDITSMTLCNAFDLVRLHKYNLLDSESSDLPVNKRPSFLAMCDFVASDNLVKRQLGEAKILAAKEAFGDIDNIEVDVNANMDWLKEMDVDRKGNYLCTINSIALILENDPIFKSNLIYDEFKQQAVFIRDLPWRKVTKRDLLNDNDFASIENYIEKVYKLSTGPKLKKGLLVVLEKLSYHPICTYLKSATWDGVARVESLMIKYLGAEDSKYTRTVTRKSLCACVARVFEPGIKFDYILTLIGDEGQGKSQLFDRLGGKWFSDTFNLHMLKGKEAYEQIQGIWIIEIGELSGMAKAEIERVKGFVAARKDNYRSPYSMATEIRLRQNIFFATTNELTPLRSQTGNRRFWPVATFESKPQESVYNLTNDDILQIWAEAVSLYEKGEKLYLDKEMTAIAKEIQDDYTEENPLVQIIENYLEMLIPENWYDIGKWEKVDFIQAYNEKDKSDLLERTSICKYEIWEILLNKKDIIDTYGCRQIKQAMTKIKGWVVIKDNRRFSNSYPRHKGSYEKEFSLESILGGSLF
jgi:putative DNA primase/helicase